MDVPPMPPVWGHNSHVGEPIANHAHWNEHGRSRLPLHHPERIRGRDSKLWNRDLALAAQCNRERMPCPCTQCNTGRTLALQTVFGHLLRHGRHPERRASTIPGEDDSSDEEWESQVAMEGDEARRGHCLAAALENHERQRHTGQVDENEESGGIDAGIDVLRMLRDTFENLDGLYDEFSDMEDAEESATAAEQAGEDPDVLEPAHGQTNSMFGSPEIVRDACRPLFAGSKCTKLAFVIMVMNLCASHRVPAVFVSRLLCFLKATAFPADNIAPRNRYEAQKLISSLGLNYVSIHACPQGHVLFRGQHANRLTCPECGQHRYRNVGKSTQPAKVLRHFPIIPRLQRLFRCQQISKLMTWTADNKSTDGLQRHIGDSDHWRFIDRRWPEFAAETRNVRLGLSLDGVNPFGDKNNVYSIWPVTLLNYNLPPWLVTKKFFVLLALLIPGPHSAVSSNIDVWVAPIVEELVEFWKHGVLTHDVLRRVGRPSPFRLHGQCILTVADYPAHGLISGQVYSGYVGCTRCGPYVTCDHSKALKSMRFQGHRRWMPLDHPYRFRPSQIIHFDNKTEMRGPPPRVTQKEITEWAALKVKYDMEGGVEGGPDDPVKKYGVKRHSILDLELEYWPVFDPSKHNLDLMHVEKNVCDALLKFLSGQKDTSAVREDLEARGIRSHLWLKQHPHKPDSMFKYLAPYVCTSIEWATFLRRLQSLKLPSGYSAAFKKHVRNNKLGSLKTHDHHVLMQQIIPVCLRGLMQKPVRQTIFRLCKVFRHLCVKVWDPDLGEKLKEEVASVMCDLEAFFPPAFFTVSPHLIVHLVEDLCQYGPVRNRWMYPMERYMNVLKGHVQTRYRPEASMALAYLSDETLGWMSEYMADYEHVISRMWDSEETSGLAGEVLEGKGIPMKLPVNIWEMAHEYVLRNTAVMEPWWQEYELQRTGAAVSTAEPFPNFADWVREAIREHYGNNPDMDRDLYLLATPPRMTIHSYKRMMAYGNHYRVRGDDLNWSVTYDSGLISVFEQRNPREDRQWRELGYVGELIDIWRLNYGNTSSPIILMKGSWVRPDWTGGRPTMKRDNDGLLLVNFRQRMPEWSEPFVFPSQVEQAFFADAEESPGWRVVCHAEARSRRVEGCIQPFTLDGHEAFDQPRRTIQAVIPSAAAYQELNRVEAWEGDQASEDENENSEHILQ